MHFTLTKDIPADPKEAQFVKVNGKLYELARPVYQWDRDISGGRDPTRLYPILLVCEPALYQWTQWEKKKEIESVWLFTG